VSGLVPIFPLPNLVLLPRAVVPLHIFEDRYRAMMADVLTGDRRLVLALLRPGWEKNYQGFPAIEPVGCVGKILQHEQLADGRYNVLLQGESRVRVAREEPVGLYRAGELAELDGPSLLEIDLEPLRARLLRLFEGPLAGLRLAEQFGQLLRTVIGTSDAADVIAYHMVEDVREKQMLLEEADPRLRIMRVVELLGGLAPRSEPSVDHLGRKLGLN
jgi:uncharacterized protein